MRLLRRGTLLWGFKSATFHATARPAQRIADGTGRAAQGDQLPKRALATRIWPRRDAGPRPPHGTRIACRPPKPVQRQAPPWHHRENDRSAAINAAAKPDYQGADGAAFGSAGGSASNIIPNLVFITAAAFAAGTTWYSR